MKKIRILWVFLLWLFLAWCNNQNGSPNYNQKLTIAWVGPEISFESTVEEWTLVLKWYFEDHSDHVFLPAGTREDKFNDESEYLPWNTVKFVWYVTPLDVAAWNHYYEVVNVDTLKALDYPSEEEVKDLLDSYNYCENDSDCGYFMWECPLWCYIPLNIKYIDIASNLVTNFVNRLWDDERCVYGCLLMNKAVCNDYKCEMIDAPAEADVHGCWPVDKDPELSCDEGWYDLVCANDWKTYKNSCFACKEPLVETFTFWQCENDSWISYCTANQKSADICTMIYAPVCWNDWKTYWNDCVACQSDTVESYTQWECESSAFVVEWDSEYLQEVIDILDRNWGVTCDLFYTDYDRQVHSFFMTDLNRFYSAIDDYSDNLQRRTYYTLSIDEKLYEWSDIAAHIWSNKNFDMIDEIASLLDDKSKFPDFEMKCYEWIDVTSEHLFEILPEMKTPNLI